MVWVQLLCVISEGIAVHPVILGLLMMFYLMFLNLYLVLALVHLLFLHQNFGIAYLMICVPLSLLSALNPNSKHTYFVKLSLRVSAFFFFILVFYFSIFLIVSLFLWLCSHLQVLGDSLISLGRLLSRRWYT